MLSKKKKQKKHLVPLLSKKEVILSYNADQEATIYIKNDVGKLNSVYAYNGTNAIYVGNGNKMPISHTGNSILKNSQANINLNNVLLVPKLNKNSACNFELSANGFF